MSVRVMSWVWSESQSTSTARFVLLAIADAANDAGAEAYPSMATLAKKTKLTERGIQKAIKTLVDLGELVVYPNAGPKGCNRYRIVMRTPEPGSPPNQVHPPEPHSGEHGSPPNDVHHPPEPGSPLPPNDVHPNHPLPVLEPKELSSSETASRPDVARICTHLADAIEANGSKRPKITREWRTQARLLLDADGRTVEQVLKAIDWCQADPFWRSNVLSMPTLRKQYERLRLAAQRPGTNGTPRGMVQRGTRLLKAETAANLDLIAAMEAKDAANGHQPDRPAIEGSQR